MIDFHQIFFSPLFLVGLLLMVLGLAQILVGSVALARRRPLRFAVQAVFGVTLALVGALAAVIAMGILGYSTLTRETVAAKILVTPTGPQRFDARVRFEDGREATFDIHGDEIYVDAHVLKWKPLANLIGLHTAYELGRIAGRYRSIEQERTAMRTVHSLGEPKLVDLFDLRNRYAWLAPLVDADYGSASFVPVAKPAELEVRVSTSGLLIRGAEKGD
jgi:hypothetical protein